MLSLIDESKTMTPCDRPVSSEILGLHRPVDQQYAEAIMAHIASFSPAELSEISRFNFPMASKLHKLAREFPYLAVGQTAVEAFTGVVFKALDYASLSAADRDFLCRNVRIISSLYGWLRPDDIIKAYRLDYTSPLSPDGKTMSAYWRARVTVNLVHELQAGDFNSILDLLPADAARCVDWKLVKRFASVWKVDFKELKEGGSFSTPHAGRLKTLRGHLLREISERHIQDPADLLTLSTPLLLPMGTPDYPDHIAFCV